MWTAALGLTSYLNLCIPVYISHCLSEDSIPTFVFKLLTLIKAHRVGEQHYGMGRMEGAKLYYSKQTNFSSYNQKRTTFWILSNMKLAIGILLIGIVSLSSAAPYEVATKQEKLAKLESLLGRALQRTVREQEAKMTMITAG